MPQHVFIETNWVIEVAAPLLSRDRDAAELYERARRGEVQLHVPAICLIEARKVLAERTVRANVSSLRAFVNDLRSGGGIDDAAANAAFDVLVRYQQHVGREKEQAPARIAALADDLFVDVFPLDAAALARSVELAAETAVALKPFDLSILAAVLVRGEALREQGHDVCFCTLDSDLQPWNRLGRRMDFANLFDRAGVWVYGDFQMAAPARPAR